MQTRGQSSSWCVQQTPARSGPRHAHFGPPTGFTIARTCSFTMTHARIPCPPHINPTTSSPGFLQPPPTNSPSSTGNSLGAARRKPEHLPWEPCGARVCPWGPGRGSTWAGPEGGVGERPGEGQKDSVSDIAPCGLLPGHGPSPLSGSSRRSGKPAGFQVSRPQAARAVPTQNHRTSLQARPAAWLFDTMQISSYPAVNFQCPVP